MATQNFNWRNMVNTVKPFIIEYERQMYKLISMCVFKESVAGEYDKQHKSGFGRKEINKLGDTWIQRFWKRKCIINIPILSVIAILGVIATFALRGQLTTENIPVILTGAGIGVLLSPIFSLFIFRVQRRFSEYDKTVRRLADFEATLEPYMKYIPVKYRNSYYLDWFVSFGARVASQVTWQEVLQYTETNPPKFAIPTSGRGAFHPGVMAIMCDVPCEVTVNNSSTNNTSNLTSSLFDEMKNSAENTEPLFPTNPFRS